MKKYAVIGTGAIGGYYGAKLVKAGFEVHFLARSDYEYIKKNGLVIDSKDGNFYLPQVNVYNNVSQMPVCDVVIISLKTTANNILPQILPVILNKENGIVIVMQNGIGTEDFVYSIVKHNRIIGGLCFICVQKTGFGHISHFDFGHISFAQYSKDNKPGQITDIVKSIADDFTKAQIKVNVEPCLGTARWKKLVWNIPYSGLSVILSADTKEINSNPYTRELVKNIMSEICTVASRLGYNIEKSFIEQMIQYTDSMVPYRASMKIDYDEKRPMEVESIFGNPLRLAQKANINVPLIETLYQQLKFLDERNVDWKVKS